MVVVGLNGFGYAGLNVNVIGAATLFFIFYFFLGGGVTYVLKTAFSVNFTETI